MQHQIHGTTLQTLEILLQPGEMVFSQTHQMSWMNDGITMDTNTGGGMLKGLLRSASGGALFVTHFPRSTTCRAWSHSARASPARSSPGSLDRARL